MDKCRSVFQILTLFSVLTNIESTIRKEGQLEELLRELISPQETIIFISDGLNLDCYPYILPKNPRLVIDVNKTIDRFLKVSAVYLICTDNNNWMERALHKLKASKIWDGGDSYRSDFFVVSNTSNIEKTSAIFWRHKITKVTLLKRKYLLDNYTKILTKHKFFNILHIGSSYYQVFPNIVKVPEIKKIVLLMYDLMNKTQGSYLEYVGDIVYRKLKLIADVLDAEITYSSTRSKNGLNDFRELDKGVLWLYMRQINDPKILEKYDVTEKVFSDTTTWLIPIIKQKTTKSMIFVFNWQTTILILAIFGVVVLLCWLFAKLLTDDLEFQRLRTWITIAVLYTLGFSSHITPRMICLRITVVAFMFYSFQLSYVYQSYMTSVLADPPDEPEIQTVDELAASSIPILVSRYGLQNLKTGFWPDYQKLRKHMFKRTFLNITANLEYCVMEGCATAMGKELFRYGFPQYSDKFYLMEVGELQQSSQWICLKRGHYILEKFNFLRNVIIENGIDNKMLEDRREKILKKKNIETSLEANIYLRFEHLQEVFLMWVIGMSIATMVFLGELLHYHCYYKHKNRNV